MRKGFLETWVSSYAVADRRGLVSGTAIAFHLGQNTHFLTLADLAQTDSVIIVHYH